MDAEMVPHRFEQLEQHVTQPQLQRQPCARAPGLPRSWSPASHCSMSPSIPGLMAITPSSNVTSASTRPSRLSGRRRASASS